ncbi:MAG: hypothetical protein E7C60_12525, partial [Clostridium perfringens]|nr:hypothetical protein [Clostridium perfringens]
KLYFKNFFITQSIINKPKTNIKNNKIYELIFFRNIFSYIIICKPIVEKIKYIKNIIPLMLLLSIVISPLFKLS